MYTIAHICALAVEAERQTIVQAVRVLVISSVMFVSGRAC
jgi:hypothetical protein